MSTISNYRESSTYSETLSDCEWTINRWEVGVYNDTMEYLYDKIHELAESSNMSSKLMARIVAIPILVIDTVVSVVFSVAQVVQNLAFAILYTLGGEGREGLVRLWEAGTFLMLAIATPVLLIRQAYRVIVDAENVNSLIDEEVDEVR
jgi:hypothetical protein